MEMFDRSNVVRAIMRNLKDVRKIEDIRTYDDKVSFQLNGETYFVAGVYPRLQVVRRGAYDHEMANQLNEVYKRKNKTPNNETPLRLARLSKPMTITQLANELDVDVGNLSRIERGMQVPSMELAERIAAYFDNTITAIQICHPNYKEKSNA